MKRIGLIGARGHVGAELIRLFAGHPGFTLQFVTSREFDGQKVAGHVPEFSGDLRYQNIPHEALADEQVDAYLLALPNGKAASCVQVIETKAPGSIVLDLSADYRFDCDWYYGLPELTRTRYQGQRRISNPGCYATAIQLAIAPMHDLLAGPVQCFGVSGYSGAGTAPSDRNDPDKLRDNLMPYALVGHLHEREVSHHLVQVQFIPHVAGYFRGLSVTANLQLAEPVTLQSVRARYRDRYAAEGLVQILDEAPWVSLASGCSGVQIGGFALADGGRRLVLVATLDNLLKGAATQALQNLNLAFGYDELQGISQTGQWSVVSASASELGAGSVQYRGNNV